MLDFFDDVFGIDETLAPGVQFAAGQFVIEGNVGEDNDIDFEDANLIVNPDTAPTAPIEFNKTQDADGESVRTQFVAYDSLGNPLNIDMTFVLENKDNTGTQWRFFAESEDDSDLDRQLSTGLINFDTDGKLISTIDGSITIDRNNTGAFTPQQIDLGFEDEFGSVSALYDVRSQVSAVNQDGSQIGTLEDFNIAENGTITGVFSNGLLRTLGQIPLAMFANNAGLTEVGGSQFRAGVNSGIATVVTATTGGSGKVIGRSLELSNVELSEEFINLISAQTGYSANSRIISTSDQLIQELLATVR
jgi:flagellar hook protein FlgE